MNKIISLFKCLFHDASLWPPRHSRRRVELKGLHRERYFLVLSVEENEKRLEAELEHSASRGHCCDWCGASGLARRIDAKLNRQYTRLAALDCKLGLPDDPDDVEYNREWRANQRKLHGHIEFFSADQWRKPNKDG